MTLQRWKSNGSTSIKVTLVECPSCGTDLEGKYNPYHLLEHSPEDIGLSPLRTRVATDGGEQR